MWGVLGALRGDACKELISKARQARSISSEENKDDLIEIHPDLLDKLMKAPSISKKKERVAFLLKKSRPIRFERKEPNKYTANLNVFQRPKVEEEEKKSSTSFSLRRANNDDSMNADSMPSVSQRIKDPFTRTPKKPSEGSQLDKDEYMRF